MREVRVAQTTVMSLRWVGDGSASLSEILRVARLGWTAALASLVLLTLASVAGAAPITYGFSSGSVTLRAVLDGTATSVLAGPAPAQILLGGTSVTFDPTAGAYGTLTGLLLVPTTTINLDLDQNVVALDSVSIDNSSLTNQVGATGVLNLFGQFNIATVMSGDVSGLLPGNIAFGPQSASSLDSAASGLLGVSGDTLTLALTGVNIARFAQLANPSGPDVIVKADFTFVGIVPEPGTAILIGLGLGGLAATRRRPDPR
ncbi:PEP-CTERM sorting domain-containing protein [Myxococcota bacterium]|nr:PEP-CTERM sorting domain-containing protein [Myxococcota bacterium]